MLHWFAKRMREMEVRGDERGFTLIELLIVIIIIGILAAIALPTFLAQREKAQIAACESDTRNAAEAAILYAADSPTEDFTDLNAPDDLQANGWNQTDGVVTTVVGVPGEDITLSSACENGGTATFTTSDDNMAIRGKVVYTGPGT